MHLRRSHRTRDRARMNGFQRARKGKWNMARYIHTTLLGSKFLPFSEMYAVNKEVLKRSSGFFPTSLSPLWDRYLTRTRVPSPVFLRPSRPLRVSVGRYAIKISMRNVFVRQKPYSILKSSRNIRQCHEARRVLQISAYL